MERDEESGLNYHGARYYVLVGEMDSVRSRRTGRRGEPLRVRPGKPNSVD